MSFLSDALSVVGKIAGKAVPGIDSALGMIRAAIIKDPAVEKALIDQEIEFRKLSIQEGDSIRKMYGMEIQSEDPFVRRVRPAMIWLVLIILGTNYALLPLVNTCILLFGGFHDVIVEGVVQVVPNVPQIVLIYPEIPDSVMAVMVTMFTVYAGARSFDKKTKAGK